VNHKFPIGTLRDGDIGREAYGCGHHKTIVIVGVFANEIDAARRAEDPWALAE
jgi:hypothetical protein